MGGAVSSNMNPQLTLIVFFLNACFSQSPSTTLSPTSGASPTGSTPSTPTPSSTTSGRSSDPSTSIGPTTPPTTTSTTTESNNNNNGGDGWFVVPGEVFSFTTFGFR